RADVFCTTEEGIKGKRAVERRLVDEGVPGSKLEETAGQRAKDFAAKSSRAAGPNGGAPKGIALGPLKRERAADGVEYGAVSVEFHRGARLATITLRGPDAPSPASADAMVEQGGGFWALQLGRGLDDG